MYAWSACCAFYQSARRAAPPRGCAISARAPRRASLFKTSHDEPVQSPPPSTHALDVVEVLLVVLNLRPDVLRAVAPAEVRDGPSTARLDAAAGDALCALPGQRGPDALALLRPLGRVGRARLRERRAVSVTTTGIPGSEGAH